MSTPDRVRYTWRDASTRTGLSLVYLPEGSSPTLVTDLQALLAPLTPCLNVLARQEVLQYGPIGGSGASGAYSTYRDKVTIYMRSLTGANETPVPIVGCEASILLGDNMTINPSDADVAALIAWLIANATDQDGNPFTSYSRGLRGFIPGGP